MPDWLGLLLHNANESGWLVAEGSLDWRYQVEGAIGRRARLDAALEGLPTSSSLSSSFEAVLRE